MPIDARLIGIQRPFDINDLNYKSAITNAAESLADERSRKVNRENAIYQALQNRPKNVSPGQHLINQGYADEGLSLEKQQSDINKQNLTNHEEKMKQSAQMLHVANQALREMLAYPSLNKDIVKNKIEEYYQAGLTDDSTRQKQLAELPNLPDDDQGIRAFINQQSQSLLKSEDFIKQNFPTAYEQARLDHDARSQDIQMRGQDITQQNNLAGQNINQAKLNQEGEKIRFNRENAAFEQAYKLNEHDLKVKKHNLDVMRESKPGAGKAPTQDQSNAYMYSNRANESNKILESLVDKEGNPTYSPLGLAYKDSVSGNGIMGRTISRRLANAMLSDDSQKADQAQRDFVNAILRRESGAVISPEEFANAKKQYFPQPGDGKLVLEQKANNRRIAIESMKNISTGNLAPLENSGQQNTYSDDYINSYAKRRGLSVEMVRKYLQDK